MFWSAAPGFQDLMLSCCAFRAYYRGLNNYQHYFGGSLLLLLYHKGPLYRGLVTWPCQETPSFSKALVDANTSRMRG